MKTIKIILLLTISIITFSSCAMQYTPPKSYDYQRSQAFDKEYDQVWQSIIDWCSMNNVPIKNMDKSSGYIASEFNASSDPSWMDCGEGAHEQNLKGNFNIVVKKVSQGTEVTINAFFFGRTAIVAAQTNGTESVKCESTGKLESQLFEYVKSK